MAGSPLDELALPSLLSAAVVSFTIECDGELERRVTTPGPLPSLVVWLNLLQYLRDGRASVAELCAQSLTSIDQVRFLVGKLELWGLLSVSVSATSAGGAADAPAVGARRQNISAVRGASVVELRERAMAAVELWPEVIDEVESRWRRRHGDTLSAALKAASWLADHPGLLLPEGVPIASANRVGARDWKDLPAGRLKEPRHGRVPVLLSRALLAAKVAYERRSLLPLALAANTLRVVGAAGVPVNRIHTLSGTSAETAASQASLLAKGGLAEVVKDRDRRARVLRLTSGGAEAQAAHARTVTDVASALDPDGTAASALRAFLGADHDGDLAIRAALTAPAGTRRFSTDSIVGRPVDARDRQIVAQTEAFRSDPFGALPHFPVWEQTRGFRP